MMLMLCNVEREVQHSLGGANQSCMNIVATLLILPVRCSATLLDPFIHSSSLSSVVSFPRIPLTSSLRLVRTTIIFHMYTVDESSHPLLAFYFQNVFFCEDPCCNGCHIRSLKKSACRQVIAPSLLILLKKRTLSFNCDDAHAQNVLRSPPLLYVVVHPCSILQQTPSVNFPFALNIQHV